jgi:hypothetical protein
LSPPLSLSLSPSFSPSEEMPPTDITKAAQMSAVWSMSLCWPHCRKSSRKPGLPDEGSNLKVCVMKPYYVGLGSHSGDHEQCRLIGCGAVWVL